MNRKTILIVALAFIILLGLGAYYYFATNKAQKPAPGIPSFGLGGTGTTEGGENKKEVGVNQDFVPNVPSSALPRLYELRKTPVAGSGFVETGKGASYSISVRSVDRGLGHIFETPLSTYIETRIVNETRPRISEALWGNGGKSVVMRYLENTEENSIKTHIINLKGTPPLSPGSSDDFLKVEDVVLPDFIPFVAVSEDKTDKLFYLEDNGASSVGYVTNSKGVFSKVFESTVTEWLPQFPNQKLVTLTTKPSANVLGYSFFLNTDNKSVTKVLSGINGLTTLTSRDGKLILFSESRGGFPELSLYDVAKKISYPLSVQTLPEKCAWSAKDLLVAYCAVPQNLLRANYPDQWYQGLVSFSDVIMKIDTKTKTSELVLNPGSLGASSLDIINPVLSSDDSYLLFMNKGSGTPWVYRLKEDWQSTASSTIR